MKQCDEKASLSSTVWKVEVGRGNSDQGTIMAFDKVSGSFYGELCKSLWWRILLFLSILYFLL